MTANAKITNENGYLCVSGQINFKTVMDIWNQSLPLLAKCKELNFDFSRVAETDSAALALLIEWMKYAKQCRQPIAFHQLPSQLKSIARVASVAALLQITAS